MDFDMIAGLSLLTAVVLWFVGIVLMDKFMKWPIGSKR